MNPAEEIQSSIVEERNNYKDYSVSGDDLTLAVAAAILLYERRQDLREWLSGYASSREEEIRQACPGIVAMLG